jgi:hypothetical protein
VRGLAGIAVVAAAFVTAGGAPAANRLPAQRAALTVLQRARVTGQIDRATAARYRAEVDRAARLIRRLPSGRREPVAVALGEIAGFSARLTPTRAAALFGQLRANDDYFARRSTPFDRTDITGVGGIVYRYFAGRCFEFHPLAEFAALNARVSAQDAAGARRLAQALLARGVHQRGGIAWEYYFAFGGGRSPWLSGMAQAVAAQAFARAARLLPGERAELLGAARSAYRVIPAGLVTHVAAGPWIRLYGFARAPVLNAQLQTVLSLRVYAAKAHDRSGARFAARLQEAAAATLPRFDTGYWTYYVLPRHLSTLHYQDYVVRLLRRLSSADRRFARTAKRFAAYRHEPPAFRLAPGGNRALRFWLSKPSTVVISSAAGPVKRLALSDGWHLLTWPTPARPGIYPLRVRAADWAGNRASFDALPIVRVAGRASSRAAPGPAAYWTAHRRFAATHAARALAFPKRLVRSAPAAVVLACIRDCLYLVTLDDKFGRPVALRRGTLRGGGRSMTLELPKARLWRTKYRLEVRLVDRVKPGSVAYARSRLLRVTSPDA